VFTLRTGPCVGQRPVEIDAGELGLMLEGHLLRSAACCEFAKRARSTLFPCRKTTTFSIPWCIRGHEHHASHCAAAHHGRAARLAQIRSGVQALQADGKTEEAFDYCLAALSGVLEKMTESRVAAGEAATAAGCAYAPTGSRRSS
jgi:hypothetical protein